jgi:hypothetical protein
MAQTTYTIFTRRRSMTDPRVRWMKVDAVQARSCPDALRKAGFAWEIKEQYGDRMPPMHSVQDYITGDLYMAERDDRIDFEHYNFDGTLVEAS